MPHRSFSNTVKASLIALGLLSLVGAVATLGSQAISFGFFAILLFSIIFGPRMSLTLPGSKFWVSFSDSLIFLSLLLYGGSAAIFLATVEMLANCLYIRSTGYRFGRLMIPVNVAINTISTTFTVLVWLMVQRYADGGFTVQRTQHLILLLGCLALAQFLMSSALAAVLQSLKDGTSPWNTWKRDCFSSSMTQIVGAGLAGIAFKVINYGDFVTASIAFTAFAVAFFYYRQSIREMSRAIEKIEAAEREKAETERDRRQEAEKHSDQLSLALMKEERANDALRKSERDFAHAALHDSLTGLPNRKMFGDVLRKLIADYKNDPTTNFQVLFLDIRSFKDINDSLGHSIGDKVLTIAAKRFVRTLSAKDTVARIGGDEFAIILRDLDTTGKAQKIARKIYQNITLPFALSGNRINIDVNIGIASCDAEYDTPEQILRDADIAMHYAKEKNAGPAVFTKDMRARFLERVRFEMDLRHAIERNELALHYQPIVSLSDGRLKGFEVLLRWHHSEFGMIPPNKFIPIAEQSDLIQPLTLWVLTRSCAQLAEWQKMSPEYRDLTVSVNISGKHLSDDELIDDIENILEDTRLQAKGLKLEITESTAMENPEQTVNILNKLNHLGVQLSLDDFGTGYSSLSYLHRLPFDTLKIDRSFVYSVGEQGENSEILQTIISLAKNLKMRVIAEGIETESQLAVLQNLGCDFGQGFLLAKPKPIRETEALLYARPYLLPFGSTPAPYEPAENTSTDDRLPVF
jgi:diguanylate cyclase (GGDEF)-like protein